MRLEALSDPKLPGMGPGHAGGNFVISRVTAQLVPPAAAKPTARFVRVALPGKDRILSLAEVQVFSGTENVALKGEARQSSTAFDGPAKLAIDGKTDGNFDKKSVTHTNVEADPWWEVDLKGDKAIDRIVLWNRTPLEERLAGYRLELLNDKREVGLEGRRQDRPEAVGGARDGRGPAGRVRGRVRRLRAGRLPGRRRAGRDPEEEERLGRRRGDGQAARPDPVAGRRDRRAGRVEAGRHDRAAIVARQPHARALPAVGHGRARRRRLGPAAGRVLAALAVPAEKRTDAQKAAIAEHYVRQVAPELKADRDRLAEVTKSLAGHEAEHRPRS